MSLTRNEKTLEILFNSFFLNSFRLGQIIACSPSTRAEAERGYDSMFKSDFSELYIQFKLTSFKKKKNLYKVHINREQLHTLKKRYQNEAEAFYVFDYFRSLDELIELQRSIKSSKQFLKRYLSVDVHSIPATAQYLVFKHPRNENTLPDIEIETINGTTEKIGKGSYRVRRCSTLVDRYKRGEIGRLVKSGGHASSIDSDVSSYDKNTLFEPVSDNNNTAQGTLFAYFN